MSFNSSKVTAYQGGSWNIDTTSAKVIKSLFNSISSVSSGSLTTILSYTVPVSITDFLGKVEVSGTDIAQFEVYINTILNARQRTYFGGELNSLFDYSFGNENGLQLNAGDVVEIKVIHNRPTVGDFEARILYAE